MKSSHTWAVYSQVSKSNSRPEYIRRIGLAASAMKKLDRVCSQSKLSITTKREALAERFTSRWWWWRGL